MQLEIFKLWSSMERALVSIKWFSGS
jgi:hypothetical protein